MWVPARKRSPEIMDRPDNAPADLLEALRDIRLTNRWLGGRRVLLRALRPHLLATPPGSTLEVLDVGTGGADLALAMLDHGRRAGRDLRVTAVDRSWPTARIAASAASGRPAIRVVCADATSLPFALGSFDLVTASLFLHHFEHADGVRLISSFRRIARRAVLINDLRRHRLPWGFIYLASRLTGRHPMYVHDAPLSVLRGFTAEELEAVAREAGASDARVHRRWPYRLLLEMKGEA